MDTTTIETVECVISLRAIQTRCIGRIICEDAGHWALEAFIENQMQVLHELAAAAFGRKRAASMVRAVAIQSWQGQTDTRPHPLSRRYQ